MVSYFDSKKMEVDSSSAMIIDNQETSCYSDVSSNDTPEDQFMYLIDLAIEMKSEISSVTRRNTDTTETSTKVNTELDELIDQVKKHRERIKNLETEISSLDTTIYDNTHLVKSINLHYIAWGISLVTIGLIAMHQLK